MAPKSKARSAPKGTAKAKAKAKAKAATSVQQVLESSSVQKRRQQFGRRDSNDKVQRTISVKFAHVPPAERASKQHEGLLLHDYIKRDLKSGVFERCRDDYVSKVCRAFGFSDATISGSVNFQDETMEVAEDITQALDLATSHSSTVRTVGPLQALMEYKKEWNRREFAGVVKAWGDIIRAGNSLTSMHGLVIEAFRCAARLGKLEEFGEELACIQGHLDEALCASWKKMKRTGVKLRTWLETYLSTLPTLLPKQDLTELLGSRSDLASSQELMARLRGSCTLGQELFTAVDLDCQAHGFAGEIATKMQSLKDADYAADQVETVQSELFQLGLRYAKRSSANAKRDSKQTFCDAVMNVPCTDVHKDWSLHFGGHIKMELIGNDRGFAKMPWEGWLEIACGPNRPSKIPDSVRKPMQQAREAFLEMVDDGDVRTIAGLKRLMRQAMENLSGIDKTWILEATSVLEHLEPQLWSYAKRKFLAALPSQSRPLTVTQATGNIKMLLETESFKALPPQCTTDLNAALDTVIAVGRKQCPSVTAAQHGSFWALLLEAVTCFFSIPAGTKLKGPRRGREGMAVYMDSLTGEPGKVPTLEQCDALMPFAYALSQEQQQLLAQWAAENYKQMGLASAASARKGSGSGAASAARKGSGSGAASSSASSASGVTRYFS